jgi:hypothetical protein
MEEGWASNSFQSNNTLFPEDEPQFAAPSRYSEDPNADWKNPADKCQSSNMVVYPDRSHIQPDLFLTNSIIT